MKRQKIHTCEEAHMHMLVLEFNDKHDKVSLLRAYHTFVLHVWPNSLWYDKEDRIAKRETWSNYLDSLCLHGKISQENRDEWEDVRV